jgi:ribose transport system ATP-binding protein
VVELRSISKRFGATVALENVDLDVRGGEIVALLGENGAGKSTLMKILSGALEPDEGRVRFDGAAYRPRDPREGQALGVAMIYQELALLPNLTVAENLSLGREPVRAGFLARRELRRRAREALRAVGAEGIDVDVRARELSISSQQLVEIARAAASGARLFIFDEPTSSLSRADADKLFALIRSLRERGHAILYVSHFLEEVLELADRYVVLRDGRAVASGAVAGATIPGLISLMVGRELTELFPRSERRAGEPVLELEGVVLRRGEVLGLAGLVGSGRSRLLRRLMRGSGGWARGVGLLSENRKEEGLALGLTIAENLVLPAPEPPRARARSAREWISRLGVRCREPEQRIGELSGGNQQKIALARLLHHGVEVYLLDEPTRGIDVASKAEIYRAIDALAREGKAVLLVSSYLPELLGICDRIAVMARGQLRPARAASSWTEESLLAEALA